LEQSSWDTSLSTAIALDNKDPLKSYRSKFHLPHTDGKPWVYLCGNSLGLQPVSVQAAFTEELGRWRDLGVEGWFEGDRPWLPYHAYLNDSMAELIGARPSEVVIMNTLTVNLHLLMASFYKPTGQKTKILMEKDAFPSDHHMIASQIKWHGLDPSEHIIYAYPSEKSKLTTEDNICSLIEKHKEEVALVILGGVNYYTGQLFDMKRIAAYCIVHDVLFGVDLAHAVGNVPMNLHDWGVDFAAWCTYKYLNSGPGGPGGAFVHDKHTSNEPIDRLAGWWGHDETSRFEMEDAHIPMQGAAGWQISTPQIMNFVALGESLKLFDKAGMDQIDRKRRQMNQYFDLLINDLQSKVKGISVVTPKDLNCRGAQFSIRISEDARAVFDELTERDIIGDWRSPDMIRISPVPLYNTYEEIHQVYTTLLAIV